MFENVPVAYVHSYRWLVKSELLFAHGDAPEALGRENRVLNGRTTFFAWLVEGEDKHEERSEASFRNAVRGRSRDTMLVEHVPDIRRREGQRVPELRDQRTSARLITGAREGLP